MITHSWNSTFMRPILSVTFFCIFLYLFLLNKHWFSVKLLKKKHSSSLYFHFSQNTFLIIDANLFSHRSIYSKIKNFYYQFFTIFSSFWHLSVFFPISFDLARKNTHYIHITKLEIFKQLDICCKYEEK